MQRTIMYETAHAALPNEACGLLLGEAHDVLFAATVPNSHDEPTRHFHIAAADAAPVVHRAIRLGVSIIGAWHSHPNGTAISPDDIERTAGADGDGVGFVMAIVVPFVSLRAWTITGRTTAAELGVTFR